MAKKIEDALHTAIKHQDTNALRKLAANARSTEQRMWFRLLAEIIDDRVKSDGLQRRRFTQ